MAAPAIVCDACGKKYKWMPQLVGKQVKCTCGQMIRVFADALSPVGAAAAAASVPATGSAPRPVVKPQAVSKELLDRLGVPPAKRSRVVDSDKEELERQRAELEQLAKGNFFRDWIVPIPIIIVGVILIFLEQTKYNKHPADSIIAAVPMVGLRVVMSVAFVIGAMFLAMTLLEVRFLGSMKNCILRFCAIALGPASIYGIMSFISGGEVNAALIGVFASLAAYSLLFWALMRIDLKDTSICVLITWILITIANYLAYRAEGMIHM